MIRSKSPTLKGKRLHKNLSTRVLGKWVILESAGKNGSLSQVKNYSVPYGTNLTSVAYIRLQISAVVLLMPFYYSRI